jgi:hypothetical protein
VLPRFEAGGEVPAGFKAKVINTPAELIRVIKQFPAEASKANLSVQDVKDAVAELKMARGGEAMMADGGRVNMAVGFPYGMYGKNVSAPLPAPYNPGPPGRGQMGMMYGRGGESAMAMGGCCGMSGQRAPARGRGGF